MHYRGIFCLHELKDFVLFLHVDFLQGVDIGERAQEQARSWVNNNEEHIIGLNSDPIISIQIRISFFQVGHGAG